MNLRHRRVESSRPPRGAESSVPNVIALALRQLLRLLKEYPREPFLAAVREAAQYGLYDLDRARRIRSLVSWDAAHASRRRRTAAGARRA
jgi:hypothetical protein